MQSEGIITPMKDKRQSTFFVPADFLLVPRGMQCVRSSVVVFCPRNGVNLSKSPHCELLRKNEVGGRWLDHSLLRGKNFQIGHTKHSSLVEHAVTSHENPEVDTNNLILRRVIQTVTFSTVRSCNSISMRTHASKIGVTDSSCHR